MSATVTKLTPSALAALLCTRICHDLINPVGALGNAFEVLDDESNSGMFDDAMDLLRTSSKKIDGKLRYLRLAFGAGGSAPGVIALDEIKSLSDGMFLDSKAELVWERASDAVEKNAARLVMNLIMLAQQAAFRGGEVKVSIAETGEDTQVTVVAAGRRAALDDANIAALKGKAPADGFDGRSIQPFYAGMIARELRGQVDVESAEERVTLTAKFPTPPTS